MPGKYHAYPGYKNAESKWLDAIPEHWGRSPIKHLVSIRITDGPHETPEFVDEGVPFLSAEAVKNNSLDFSKKRGYITRYLQEAYSKKCLPQINDVFMVKSGNTTGALAIVETDEEFNIWSPLALIRANQKKVLPRFVFYSMLADFFQTSVELSWSQGTQPNIGMGVIENLHVATAPLEEQKWIINFLDHETAKIDILIEKQQQLIKLLQEKRQAVISHAVTKGLNPNAPMRDSGVEWLGDVPEHWELVPLKYLCKFSGGGTPSKENLSYWSGGNIPWVSPKDMKSFWLSDTQDKLTEKAVKESSTNFVESGALLMVVRSGILQRTIPIAINTVRVTLNQDMKALRFNSQMNVEYAANFILGCQDSLLLEWSKEGATVESIEHEYLSNGFFPVPPIEEQEKINESIKERMNVFQSLEKHAIRGIALLQERRTALISAAVTGKIDVRNWQAS